MSDPRIPKAARFRRRLFGADPLRSARGAASGHVVAAFAVVLMIGLVATGCTTGARVSATGADLHVVEAAQPDRNPLAIIVFKDETPSRKRYGVPELTVSDFETTLKLLQHNGGDLAIGWIRDRSNK